MHERTTDISRCTLVLYERPRASPGSVSPRIGAQGDLWLRLPEDRSPEVSERAALTMRHPKPAPGSASVFVTRTGPGSFATRSTAPGT